MTIWFQQCRSYMATWEITGGLRHILFQTRGEDIPRADCSQFHTENVFLYLYLYLYLYFYFLFCLKLELKTCHRVHSSREKYLYFHSYLYLKEAKTHHDEAMTSPLSGGSSYQSIPVLKQGSFAKSRS